jgi:hypothetical protein
MAHLLQLTCPVDDLLFDVAFLQRLSDELSLISVGGQSHFWADTTIMCPNGHFWGVNFNMTFTRTA